MLKENSKPKANSKRRLSPEIREKEILDGAIRFFAEHGFEATTRALAKELGITQPLLYRYFPSKDLLVERVFQEVFLRRWNPDWEDLIVDRSRSLESRLFDFYSAYAATVYDYIWVRIFIYAGLKGMDLNSRYLTIVNEKILVPICGEVRHAKGITGGKNQIISDEEIEMAWGLHGAFFYRAIRRYVYSMPESISDEKAIFNDIHQFLHGALGSKSISAKGQVKATYNY